MQFSPLCPWEEKKGKAEGASVKRREAQDLEKSNNRCVREDQEPLLLRFILRNIEVVLIRQ